MDWLALVLAVAVGVWLALILLVVSAAALWTVHRRRRRVRSGDTLADLLRRRKVID